MSKVALVTGGSSGLGFEMAKKLAQKKYTVIILARNKKQLDRAVAKIKKIEDTSAGFQCDVRDEETLIAIREEVEAKFGKIDFLILNAGVSYPDELFIKAKIEELKSELDINLWGAILSANVFLPLLDSGSKVLFISSALGLAGMAGSGIYSATKAGMIVFAESLRRELLCRNISVSVACPGDIDTPMYQREINNMPDWMSRSSLRDKVMRPEIAAEKILKKCSGKKFLILIDSSGYFLSAMSKILPGKARDFIFDSLFPRPQK